MDSYHSQSGFLWIIQLAERLNILVSQHVNTWSSFDKAGLGDQLMRATDSRIEVRVARFIDNAHQILRGGIVIIEDGVYFPLFERNLIAFIFYADREILGSKTSIHRPVLLFFQCENSFRAVSKPWR
jgi:hypothetical protein